MRESRWRRRGSAMGAEGARWRRAPGRTAGAGPGPAVWALAAGAVLACGLFAGPAGAETLDFTPPRCAAADRSDARALECNAPTIRVREGELDYNRIGTPELYSGWIWRVKARVNPERPALFVERREDTLGGRPVHQLVYRFHFEKIPLRLSRYFFEAHRNPGLMVLVTLDAETGDALFVSAVHTCGCYLAIVPTDAVDPAWLPEGWSETRRIYGQELPGRLPAADVARGVRVTLESRSHRVSAIEAGTAPGAGAGRRVELPLVPMSRLDDLAIDGRQGARGSFFYTAGPLRGHVRGAWNPMEGLTAFGLLSLDPTVGMDKKFGDPEVTGTRFYTLLPFWLHEASRLDRMDSLLRALGYRLP